MHTDKMELRGQAPSDLVQALDALALAVDMTRTDYINGILEKHVRLELHRHSLTQKMLRDNPMLADAERRVL